MLRSLVVFACCLVLFAITACAGGEYIEPAVDEADGIRAESRTGSGCEGSTCLVTTLTDVATNVELATVIWNADTGVGTITEATRTTKVTIEELDVMTAAQANEAARATWLSLAERPDAVSEVADGVASAGATCTETIKTGWSCTCLTRVCMACVPTSTGEYCSVSVVNYCWANAPAYQARCTPMQA